MRILIATDAFPPTCGGSGWSTYELARGLRQRGHELFIVQPRPGQAEDAWRRYEGFEVREMASASPRVPFVRNYAKNERLWRRLGGELARIAREDRVDVLHAQHVLTAPAAVRAGRAAGVPGICTVRVYWPVCYWATLIFDPAAPELCPACTVSMMARCIRPRAGALWPAALPLVPYMRGNLQRKQQALGLADAVVAVSTVMARDLRERSHALDAVRMDVIPNPVDVAGLREMAARTTAPVAGPYAVYVGKLEINKGSHFLLPAVSGARLRWPLVIVGDGQERASLETEAAARGLDIRFTGWLARADALAWLAHAYALVFPSYGPESLSRVLLEAAALGVPIAAMDTGGTRDIIVHGVTGLLARDAGELGAHLAQIASDPALAGTLARQAREHVERTFAVPRVAERMESLYLELVAGRAPHA
jgi:glycosyltransferase involved in cell wall biosynthesis